MDGSILSDDPYLQYQPAFAYTLPSQLLVTGVTLTLLGVLLIHLLCEFCVGVDVSVSDRCVQGARFHHVIVNVLSRFGLA